MELTFGSVFSGCSGSDYAFRDWRCRFAVETNKYCCDTYEHNLGYRPFQQPVNTFHGTKVDLVIGGPPCQSFSNARTGGYSGGYRSLSGLENIVEFARIVQESDPDYFIMENAPTLLQSSMNVVLNHILTLLSNKHEVRPYLVTAEHYGIPQQRERVFFLGTRRGLATPFLIPRGDHWRVKYSGWADYLGLPDIGLLIRRGNALKGKTPFEAAYTVVCADLPYIRYSASPKASGSLSKNERVLVDQRPLTIRELARLQGFPDSYEFLGNETEQRKMIGNAWNVAVAEALEKEVRRLLNVTR